MERACQSSQAYSSRLLRGNDFRPTVLVRATSLSHADHQPRDLMLSWPASVPGSSSVAVSVFRNVCQGQPVQIKDLLANSEAHPKPRAAKSAPAKDPRNRTAGVANAGKSRDREPLGFRAGRRQPGRLSARAADCPQPSRFVDSRQTRSYRETGCEEIDRFGGYGCAQVCSIFGGLCKVCITTQYCSVLAFNALSCCSVACGARTSKMTLML